MLNSRFCKRPIENVGRKTGHPDNGIFQVQIRLLRSTLIFFPPGYGSKLLYQRTAHMITNTICRVLRKLCRMCETKAWNRPSIPVVSCKSDSLQLVFSSSNGSDTSVGRVSGRSSFRPLVLAPSNFPFVRQPE